MRDLLLIFTNPAAVFDRVRERPTWIIPLAAYLLVATVTGIYATQKIGLVNIVRRQMENNKFVAQMSPEQVETMVQQAASPARQTMTFVAIPLILTLTLVIVSALLLGLMAMMDGKASFKQVFTMAAYSYWAYGLATGLLGMLVLTLMSDPTTADPRNLLMFNLGALLDPATTNKAIYSLASSLDLFSLALVALLALGMSRLNRNVTFTKGLTAVGAAWVVWVLGRSAMSLIF